jgi:hypothetical protein
MFVYIYLRANVEKKSTNTSFSKKKLYFCDENKKLQTKKMKKLILMAGIIGMFSVVACGPSAEEIAKKEQAKADSIAAVEKEKLDALAAEREKAVADSIASAKEKAIADSIAMAEEMAAAKKKGVKPAPKKTMEQKVKEEEKKATKGRG